LLPLREQALVLHGGGAGALQLRAGLRHDCVRPNPIQVLEGLEVEERPAAESPGQESGRARAFTVRLRFAPPHAYPPEAGLTFGEARARPPRLPGDLARLGSACACRRACRDPYACAINDLA